MLVASSNTLFHTYSCLKLLRIFTNQEKVKMAEATLIVAKVNARQCRVFTCEGVKKPESAEGSVSRSLISTPAYNARSV
jgi:hypothetical protein